MDSIEIAPSAEEGGALISATLIGNGRSYTLDWGDGSLPEENTAGRFSHLYTKMGSFTVTGRDDRGSVTGTVTIINTNPIVYPAFHTNGYQFSWREKTEFVLLYRESGCNAATGNPEFVTGVWDPDGDVTELRFTIAGPDSNGKEIEYSVFLRDGTNVTGQWFAKSEDAVYVFIGENKEFPDVPPPLGANLSSKEVCPGDPWPDPVHGVSPVAIRLEARDTWGGYGERLWGGSVTIGNCNLE
jgi:hypothetical protein